MEFLFCFVLGWFGFFAIDYPEFLLLLELWEEDPGKLGLSILYPIHEEGASPIVSLPQSVSIPPLTTHG